MDLLGDGGASEDMAPFKDQDSLARLPKVGRGDEPIVARPYDDCVVCRHPERERIPGCSSSSHGRSHSIPSRSITYLSKSWTWGSWELYRPPFQARDRMPFCESSHTFQSWRLMRSHSSTASLGSKSGRAIVSRSKRNSHSIRVRSGASGYARWIMRKSGWRLKNRFGKTA